MAQCPVSTFPSWTSVWFKSRCLNYQRKNDTPENVPVHAVCASKLMLPCGWCMACGTWLVWHSFVACSTCLMAYGSWLVACSLWHVTYIYMTEYIYSVDCIIYYILYDLFYNRRKGCLPKGSGQAWILLLCIWPYLRNHLKNLSKSWTKDRSYLKAWVFTWSQNIH